MKKVIYIVSTVIVVTLLSGCGEKATSKKNIPFTGSDIVDTTDDYAEGFFYSPSFYSLADYKKYIDEQSEEGNVPEHFLGYEKLSFLGNFKSIVLLSGFDRYLCTFNNNGTEFDMTVYHALSNYMKENPLDLSANVFSENIHPQNPKDVRMFGEGEEVRNRHFYVFNNLRYAFFDGKLENVSWYANGTYYLIGTVVSGDYSSYPLTSNTFQAKLLNLDTAVDAIRENFGEPEPIENFFNQQ